MIFLVLSGKMIFVFTRKYDVFSLDRKWKMIFLLRKIISAKGLCTNVALQPVGTFQQASILVEDSLVAPKRTAASTLNNMAVT